MQCYTFRQVMTETEAGVYVRILVVAAETTSAAWKWLWDHCSEGVIRSELVAADA